MKYIDKAVKNGFFGEDMASSFTELVYFDGSWDYDLVCVDGEFFLTGSVTNEIHGNDLITKYEIIAREYPSDGQLYLNILTDSPLDYADGATYKCSVKTVAVRPKYGLSIYGHFPGTEIYVKDGVVEVIAVSGKKSF